MNDMRYKEDPDLAPEGHEYAEALKDFLLSYRARQRQINAKEEDKRPLNVRLNGVVKGRSFVI
jgi:hypothetical protein